jgi:Holliday junction resolvase-like predicted endonuclease
MRPKDIGTSAETAVKRWLQDNGWPDADRQPLRGSRDEGDLIVCRRPLIVAEIKAGQVAEKASDNLIREWLEQTETERANSRADVGVLVVRRFRRPVALWDAWMDAASWGLLLDGRPWRTLDAPWPLRASLADFSDMARQWVQR